MIEKVTRNKNFYSQTWFFLTILFVISFIISYYRLPDNLFFGPEQGIDFQVMKKIVIDHHFVLIGAKTDIPGVFHGPIYYYIASVPFLISHGDPLFIAGFLNVLDSLTVFFIYLLSKELLNKKTAIIASILFTFSYSVNIYSRWLSSHPLVIPLSVLFFLFLNSFLKEEKEKPNKWNLLLVAFWYALLGQAEFLNFVLFGSILFITFLIFHKTFLKNKKMFFFSLFIMMVCSIGNFALFDIRNGFLITKSLLRLITGNKGYYVSYIQSIQSNISTFMLVVSHTITPFSLLLASIVTIIGLYFLFEEYKEGNKRIILLFLWIYSFPIILIGLRHIALEQFFVGMISGIIILKALIISRVLIKNKILGYGIFVFLIILNMYALIINLPRNSEVFFQSTQPNLAYADEIKVIDTIYKREHGKNFSFQSYTIPYWSQQGWEYLFWYRGKQKYGYLPVESKGRTLYVIVQDDPSYSTFQANWLKNIVSKWGREDKKQDFQYGVLRVKVLKVP